jgi:ferritin-like metal-binding protein YciE
MQHVSLHDVFIYELRDIYTAEQQISKALPKLIRAVDSDDLRDAFETHLDETRRQIGRLEEAFDLLNQKVGRAACDGMTGILEESRTVMSDDPRGPIRDAALIAAAQRVEHYETAVYGTLVAWAKSMGHDQVAGLLQSNLDEAKNADEQLTQLAVGGINDAAVRSNGSSAAARRRPMRSVTRNGGRR